MRDIDFSPMSKKPDTPKVGVAVMIWNHSGSLLMGRRRGSHGAGLWSVPGGHVDIGETWEQTSIREVEEECGIKIWGVYKNRPFVTEDIMADEGLHYMTVFCTADWDLIQEPVLKPDEKFEEWLWVKRADWHSMDLFMPLQKRLKFEW